MGADRNTGTKTSFTLVSGHILSYMGKYGEEASRESLLLLETAVFS